MTVASRAGWGGEKRAEAGSNFAVAFWFLPKPRREAIQAVYGFCRRADDAVDNARDAESGRAALQQTARLLDAAYRGGGRDPLSARLAAAVEAYSLPRRPFEDLLSGIGWDLERRRYGNAEELRAYCYRVASTVGLLCVRIFGCREGACDRYAEELGIALQWTNILRDVGSDLQRGRLYLPADSLRRHGLTESDLTRREPGVPDRVTGLIRAEAAYARERFAAAAEALPASERRRVLAGEIMAAVYRDLLRRVERAGAAVLDAKIRVPAVRRLAIASRVYARGKLVLAPRGIS